MNPLFEWLPLLIFFAVFKARGIYWATGALMIACVALLLAHRLRTGRYKPMHAVTAAVALLLGAATLLLHDERFIQWKPTVLLALAAGAFLGSARIGRQPLARRLLEGAFAEDLGVAPRTWLIVNALWAAWFALLAAANLYVARNFSDAVWVDFKVFGLSIATLAFMIPQVLWLGSRGKPAADRS
ncbi:MAG TPA: septation protein IspZ [Steroidobacteraceae bacterium]|nr:septation protein IspZ [Steroidobacteraceae bacterium]